MAVASSLLDLFEPESKISEKQRQTFNNIFSYSQRMPEPIQRHLFQKFESLSPDQVDDFLKKTSDIISYFNTYLSERDMFDELFKKYPTEEAEVQQLPLPMNPSASRIKIKVLSLAQMSVEELKTRFQPKIDKIVKKYFHVNVLPEYFDYSQTDDFDNISLLFVIGSNEQISAAPFSRYADRLKDNGSMILLNTRTSQFPVVRKQLCDTLFEVSFLDPVPVELSDFFVPFFAGHIFYMKRLPDSDNAHALIAPILATFQFPKSDVERFITSLGLSKVFAVEETKDGSLVVTEKVVVASERDNVLPINYCSTKEKAKFLVENLSSDWSTVIDATKTQYANEPLRKLNQYFKSYLVYNFNANKSLFTAINTLFALRGIPLLTVQSVLQNLMAYHTPKDLENENLMQIVRNQNDLLNMFLGNYVLIVDAWCPILAKQYNIRIVKFTTRGNPKVFPAQPVNWPTFFILQKGISEVYPLFPIKDIVESSPNQFVFS